MDITVEIEGNDYFFTVGEQKSHFQVMPFQEYTLSYSLLPIGVGRMLMPRLFIYHTESTTTAEGVNLTNKIPYVTGFGKKILITK